MLRSYRLLEDLFMQRGLLFYFCFLILLGPNKGAHLTALKYTDVRSNCIILSGGMWTHIFQLFVSLYWVTIWLQTENQLSDLILIL
jgi:hypothetical protein